MTLSRDSVPHQHFLWLWWTYTGPGGWTEYRRLSSNKLAWFQRFVEAWWILTGEWSLGRAYTSAMARSRIMRPPSMEEVGL
jgi:hypothetical protein